MFLTYIYRELRRRHRQALLTALGLAIGVALVITVTAAARGVGDAQDEVLHSLYGVGTDITVTQPARLEGGGPSRFGMTPPSADEQGKKFSRDAIVSTPGLEVLSTADTASLSRLSGVSTAVSSLTLTAIHVEGKFPKVAGGQMAQPRDGAMAAPPEGGTAQMAPIKVTSYSITGVDVSSTGVGPLSSSELVEGRSFASSEDDARVALVDQGYARQHSLDAGSKVEIDGTKYEVIGVVASPEGGQSSNLYVPLGRAQRLAGDRDAVNQVYVSAAGADQIGAVKGEIEQALPKATVTTAEDLAGQVSGSLSSASKLAGRLGTWLALAGLIVAFAVACLLTMSSVARRVREFGTLKALGWRSRRIVGQVVGESLVQGVIGAALGVALGFGGARLIAALTPSLEATVGGASQGMMGGGGGVPGGMASGTEQLAENLGMAAHTVTVQLGAPISGSLLLLAVGLAVAGGLLAGALGGWRAARLRPADALRRVD